MKRKSSIKSIALDRIKHTHVILISSAILLLFAILTSFLFSNWLILPLGITFILVEISFFWAYATISHRSDAHLSDLNGMTMEFLLNLTSPVAILDKDGNVLWFNKAFQKKSGLSSRGQENIRNIVDGTLPLRKLREKDLEEQEERPVVATLNGEKFQITAYLLEGASNTNMITLWTSLAREKVLEDKLAQQNALVSYIAVDNYSEADGFLQGNYRTITAKISILLKEWANEMDAILREVENDRYILLAEEKHLSALVEKKFDVLDRVRDISKDNVGVPVTISIGMAK